MHILQSSSSPRYTQKRSIACDKSKNDENITFCTSPNWKPSKCPSIEKCSNNELNLSYVTTFPVKVTKPLKTLAILTIRFYPGDDCGN